MAGVDPFQIFQLGFIYFQTNFKNFTPKYVACRLLHADLEFDLTASQTLVFWHFHKTRA